MRLLNSILHGLNAAPGPPAWLMPGGVHMWRGDVLGLTGAGKKVVLLARNSTKRWLAYPGA